MPYIYLFTVKSTGVVSSKSCINFNSPPPEEISKSTSKVHRFAPLKLRRGSTIQKLKFLVLKNTHSKKEGDGLKCKVNLKLLVAHVAAQAAEQQRWMQLTQTIPKNKTLKEHKRAQNTNKTAVTSGQLNYST